MTLTGMIMWDVTTAQCTGHHSFSFVCIDDDGVTGWWWWYDDGYRGMTREEALFTVPSGVTSSILGLIFPKNTSSNHPTNMQMNLFCPVSPPGLSALMFCCRALLSCSCLCLCKACCCACLHIGPGDGLEPCPLQGHSSASGYFVLTSRNLPLSPWGWWAEN